VLYRLTHQTSYHYDRKVSVSHHVMTLRPRDLPWQHCRAHELCIRPEPGTQVERTDYFGNHSVLVTFESAHREFEVVAGSVIAVQDRPVPGEAGQVSWESVAAACAAPGWTAATEAGEFRFDSPYVRRQAVIGRWAAESFPAGRAILKGVSELNERIHDGFHFDSRATTVATPVEEVFAKRRGVCQDFAHVMLVALRTLGLPARYVSGYLETQPPPGKARLIGADASHAWVSVWVPGAGWVDFDPTNNVMPGRRHVTVAWGRDFGDVSPVRGVLVGSGEHSLRVSVDLEPVNEEG
jgi:transglutaminase-like putative cysteine protease